MAVARPMPRITVRMARRSGRFMAAKLRITGGRHAGKRIGSRTPRTIPADHDRITLRLRRHLRGTARSVAAVRDVDFRIKAYSGERLQDDFGRSRLPMNQSTGTGWAR